jgi:hypothetical protein
MAAVGVVLLSMILVSACGTTTDASPTPPTPTSPEEAKAIPVTGEDRMPDPDVVFPELEMAAFDDPTNIDNEFFPLKPGMQYVYDGFIRQGANKIPRRMVFTVTDLTREVAGVETVVAHVEERFDGELVESDMAFYAQDNDGNVWFLGEYQETYEADEEIQAWVAGLDDAQAGIVMNAEPEPETPPYAQSRIMNRVDHGRVVAAGQQVCAPAGCYEDVLVTEEFHQQEPDAPQVTFYAPEVGLVKVGWRQSLELISLTELSEEALAEVRSAALLLEEHANVRSEEVSAATAPLDSAADPATVAEFWELDPASFTNSTVIDNSWMPMQPGTRWVYEGTALDDEGNTIARRIEFTVTDLTKEIGGVRTVATWILDYDDDQVVEKELAFYAQDDDGNVWYLGEYPEEFEDGEFVRAAPWIHGLEDARAGIKMMAEPKSGIPSYYQGWGPAVEWSDYGQVEQVGQETCVPVDCYTEVLVIAESSLGEENAYQLKYYARGVGEVRVGWKGEDETHEELELVERTELSPEELAELRALALELETHGFEVSKDVYGQTSPLE